MCETEKRARAGVSRALFYACRRAAGKVKVGENFLRNPESTGISAGKSSEKIQGSNKKNRKPVKKPALAKNRKNLESMKERLEREKTRDFLKKNTGFLNKLE